ncbi:hypothetical protein PGB90_006130 [Kerria lacca]
MNKNIRICRYLVYIEKSEKIPLNRYSVYKIRINNRRISREMVFSISMEILAFRKDFPVYTLNTLLCILF